jgi:phage tail tape-measure protein
MAINNDVKYTVSLRDRMTEAIRRMTGQTEKLNDSVKKTNKSLLDMRNASRMVDKTMSAFGIGLGIAGVVSFGKSVIESLKNYEYFSASLRTLMHGDVQSAKALESQLVELAKKTPFSLVEVQDATKQLMAYGFSAGSVTKNIAMLGDVASALKIPFGDIAYIYGTLRTQGRAYTRDIMQFTQRGIPVVAELAKQYNTTTQNVQKLVEQGKVGFADIEKAFQSMTAEGGVFFNMMDEQSKTVGGRISMLGDSFEQLKVNIGKGQTGIIAGITNLLEQSVSALSRYFAEANRMYENFAKNGAQQFNFFEKALHETVGLLSGYHAGYYKLIQAEDFERKMYALSNTATENIAKAYESKATLLRYQVKAYNDLKKGETSEKDYLRRRATIKGALGDVEGQIRLFSEKGKVQKPETGMVESTALSGAGATKAEAPKYTQINISVNKMQASENIYIESGVKQSENQIANKVLEMLTGALNDSQRMAGVH